MTKEAKIEIKTKVIFGLAIAFEKMLEFKRQKNSELVVIRDNKIVRIKP
jgi:hypothetical protein